MVTLYQGIKKDIEFIYLIIILTLIMTICMVILDIVYNSLVNIGGEELITFYNKMRGTLVTLFITILAVLGISIPATFFAMIEEAKRYTYY